VRFVAFLASLLTVCASASTTPSVSRAAPPTAGPTATASLPAPNDAPAPHISVVTDGDPYPWDSRSDGLPAVSPDGAFVAYAYALDDGGRGFPNLYVGMLRVGSDAELTTALFTSEEVAQDSARPKLPALIQRRVAAINARLRSWSAMTTREREAVGFDAPQTLSVSGLEVRYEAPRLVVLEGGHRVLARALAGGPASNETCEYASQLASASIDERHRILLVAIGFSAAPDWCPTVDVHHAFRY
jgi:hypothetical protein